MLRVDPGYDPRQVLVMGLSVQRTAHESQTARQRFFSEVEERARAMPSVEAAALTNHVPIGGDHWNFPVFIEGRPYSTPGAGPKALFRVARSGYFAAMRIPVRRGRDFTVDDLRATSRSVIVNESMARRHWPGESPLGKRLSVDDPSKRAEWFTVIGVVGDIRQNRWTEESGDEMYYPYIAYASDEVAGTLVSFLHPTVMSLVIRGGGDQAVVTRGVREIVRAIDRDVPVANIATMETIISGQLAQPKFYLMLLGAFAVVALLLAAVGVYGVISYSVAQRTRELGVRAALGATSADAFRLVMTHGAVLIGIGCLIGLTAALGAAQLARSLLYSVAPTDMATFGAVSALLLGVGLVACYIPGRRAASVDPVIALREE
jgi:putative ABC transport system permease protein